MILPPEFIDSVTPDALNDFLDHLILSHTGMDTYDGNLENDRQHLLRELKKGAMLIEHSDDEESGSFGLITKQDAKKLGYLPN